MADDFNRAKDLFKLNERVFGVVGVWPLQSTYVKFAVWIVYFLIHIIMILTDLFHVFGNLELVVLNLTESATHIIIFLKLLVMRFSQTLVKLTRRVMDDIDAKLFESTEEMEIYLHYHRISKRFFKIWLTAGIISATVYNLRPLQFRLESVLRNESMPFILAHRTRLFFEITESSTFWLVWIYQCPIGYIVTVHAATIGYLFNLILHICGQLSVLVFRIKSLELDPRDNREFSGIFRDIVDRHRNILRLARDINKVFGLILLEEVFITSLLIGATCYNVLQNVDFENTAVFVAYLLYGFEVLLLIYGYCVAGEYLITESANLYAAYYQCQWYNVSGSFKKQLIICMICANKPIQLNGGGIYIFSLSSFMNILKTSAGYVSMLRTMS